MTIPELLDRLRALDIRLSVEGDRLSVNAPTGAVEEDLRDILRVRKAEILQCLRGADGAGHAAGTYPLSATQQRVWRVEQLHPGSAAQNVACSLRLTGVLQRAALEWSLGEVVARHDVLRTSVAMVDSHPVGVVASPGTLAVAWHDIGDLPPDLRAESAQRLGSEHERRAFDLGRGPLFRLLLIRLGDHEHILSLVCHALVADSRSMGVFVRHLASLYATRVGEITPPSPPRVQYGAWALQQRERGCTQELAYWRERLQDAPPVLELPTDRPRLTASRLATAQHLARINPEVAARLHGLCDQVGVSVLAGLLAAFTVLLHRYTGQADILVGTAAAPANGRELDDLIGPCANELPLRCGCDGDPRFRELLARVGTSVEEARAHSDVPYDRLLEALPAASVPLQVSLNLQDVPADLQVCGLGIRPMHVCGGTASHDLTVDAWERSEGLALRVGYNTDLFEPETVARMAGHLETLLTGGVADPERTISALPLLTTPERQWLVKDRNATRTDYPRDRRIHELFEVQAGETPEAIALVQDATRWTYDELNRKANRLAHALRRLGVGRGVLVGVFMQRSPEMIMALLAILKAGGAYVPLDLSSPADRIDSMLRDAAAPVVITQTALLDRCAPRAARTLCLDSAHDATLEAEPEANPDVAGDPLDLAYVMYTSGSTGQPKGVAVPHRGVVRLVKNTNYARLAPDEVFLQLAPVSFDASTLEIWGSLLNGARLVLFPGQIPSLDELAEVLSRHQVTILWLTAGLFHQVVEERLDALRPVRQLLAGGDVLSAPHVRRTLQSLPGIRLINGYGPTENTTFTCCHPMTDPAHVPDSVPIGRPIANTTVYILDRQMQPVPVGVRGELWTGGDGLAAGYFNRPELTAERFAPDPFGNAGTDRLYRTGDFARYLPDGTIQFLGRMDDQVKIRGFRIELGEIEASLLRHPAVRQAVVIVRDEPLAGRQLLAYLVADGLERTGARDLRAFLKAILPDYMIPAAFVWLDRLPLTPNGKVDRRALPPPTEATAAHPEATAAPWSELELRLARLWEETLGVKRVGRRDNFFDLGGHSLLAARLFARMEKEFGRKFPLAVLFTAPSVEQLAVLIRQEGWSPSWRTLVPIQPQGSRPPIFAVPGVGGNVVGYAPLAECLGSDQPLYGLQARGLDGEAAPLRTFEEMAAHHLAEIRTVQPKGPYHLVGLCIGGVIAYEMAQQLVRAGEEVGMLAMLETWPPPPVRRIRASARLDRALAFFWLLLDRVKQYSITLARLPMNERWEFLVSRASILRSMLVHRNPFGEAQNEVSQTLVERANVRALDHYTVRPYPGRILYVLAEARRVPYGLDTRGVWRRSAVGGYEHFTLPTEDSGHMLNEPHVRVLAARLAEYLQRVTAPRATAEHRVP